MTTRRQFLKTGAVAATALTAPRILQAATTKLPVLEAMAGTIQLAPEGYPATDIWGYDGGMPGPEIRVLQGARVQRQFVNDLPQASSVHWHGIRIANAMDGVPGVTQDAVAPGGRFDYDFVAPDAGTYWYHAHNRSTEQVARGLYGALIVEEAAPPQVDLDQVLILDDWLLDPETAQLDPDFEAPHDRSHAGRYGNFIATNGTFGLSFDVRQHDRLRLRLVNAANARIFGIGLDGMTGWTVALDGMPLAAPEPVTEAIVLGPGQRVDLIVDITAAAGETAHLLRLGDEAEVSQVAFAVTDTGQESRPAPAALPANPKMAPLDLTKAARLTLNMEGGAMGRMQGAILDGERKSFRELAAANVFWAFNGAAGMMDDPLADLQLGQTAQLEMVNDTAFPHAMHLHGMHFREVLTDGTQGPMRDTLLMASGETRTIAFAADNPGDWLLHCHMLSHAASGMMTWIRVA